MGIEVSSAYVAQAAGLSRRFGTFSALDGVTLEIPRGGVFGLVGENGAGKSTLIKLMLGMLRPTSGTIRLFGHDPVAAPEQVLSRIGYLSEDRDLPDWMRVWELIRYTRAFYPDWDDRYAEELLNTFGLDLNAKIKSLSRGQRAQAGLLIALAYRPPLLILDEPSSGLDVVVRRDILGAIIRTVADEGRTVLFSSHFLDEVERVADHVALIHQSKLVLAGPLDLIKSQHHRLTLRFAAPQERPPVIAHSLLCEGGGNEWTAIAHGEAAEVIGAAQSAGAEVLSNTPPSLEDIFVAHVGKGRGILERD